MRAAHPIDVTKAQPSSGGQVTFFFSPPVGCIMLVKSQKSSDTVTDGVSPGGLPYSSQCEPQSTLAERVAFSVKEL
jgi:hypothetical protein